MDVSSHYVAFIDILGFKNIVEEEKLNQFDKGLLKNLYECHISCEDIFKDFNIDLVQFSDSIVISKAFSKDSFEEFAKAVSLYQILLLKNGFLCRGGIALNKHYSKSGFIFSPALIEAYKVESEKAIYPRIVISEDLIDFLYPSKVMPNILCKEYDGLYFINYITNELDEETHQVLLSLIDNCITNKNPSIAQKGLWLAGYSDVVYQTQSCPSRFTLFND
ncbi:MULTISPECIES: hypothetical protein [Klebsiella]|uniref:hypothetical protein n=1 Tax=Klebsiella TaxID=570 RepID=UPI0004355AFE|nr:hypothetical protein [Klebsiella quasipneumoniae]EIY4986815.1 hypothetical protein [Klebsiella quasipneumoniae]EIY5072871.1 hypothetical protein [Klebsiella quasipneumoniae]MCJ1851316.1 hypothetical protein [Klebsiella quasipneumoniae subsp. similipneumoniae]MDQ2349041.1 hypothetical protein [Klebsiella quasipneumoniae]MEB6582800.1 hypothetical protein [Klebsiella quasipneumoniae]